MTATELESAALIGSAVLARAGLVLCASGAGRAKCAGTTAFRSLLEAAVVTVAIALAAGVSRWLGDGGVGLAPLIAGALLASGAISGAVSERSTTRFGIAAAMLYALLVFPAGHLPAGYLTDRGLIDTGGASPFHLVAGVVAVVAATLLGPRSGRFHRDGSIAVMPGHQLPLTLAGFTVYSAGFVGVTAALGGGAQTALHLLLAASAGVLATAAYSRLRLERIDPSLLVTGVAASLVAACVGVGDGGGGAALIALAPLVLGAVAALLGVWLHLKLERALRCDDVTGLAAGQLAGATTGLLAAAIPVAITSGLTPGLQQLLTQCLGLALFALPALISAVLVLWLLAKLTPVRSSEQAEYDGLDLSTHDLNAYPDFSQPMIRSYHTREV